MNYNENCIYDSFLKKLLYNKFIEIVLTVARRKILPVGKKKNKN